MARIYHIPLERLATRPPFYWELELPRLLKKKAVELNRDIEVYSIEGIQRESKPSEGAFINFADTHRFKHSQYDILADNFSNGYVKAGDSILITDAWTPIIPALRYVSDLMDIPINIHAMWHAGSYDPHDFLGRKIRDKRWSYDFERSLYYACDFNYFATQTHVDLFCKTILQDDDNRTRIMISGQPHDVLLAEISKYSGTQKKDRIVFPHRLAPEKQPEIFYDLKRIFKDVEFVVCQEKTLTKDEYHELFSEAKIVFSANLQETLGISTCIEGPMFDAVPFAPNRLTYTEIFKDFEDFLYPSEWTANWNAYIANREKLCNKLSYTLKNYDKLVPILHKFNSERLNQYVSADVMITNIVANTGLY